MRMVGLGPIGTFHELDRGWRRILGLKEGRLRAKDRDAGEESRRDGIMHGHARGGLVRRGGNSASALTHQLDRRSGRDDGKHNLTSSSCLLGLLMTTPSPITPITKITVIS